MKKCLVQLNQKLRGDATGLRGDVDQCGLTGEDRANGIQVSALLA
jgi:hypothetical protein